MFKLTKKLKFHMYFKPFSCYFPIKFEFYVMQVYNKTKK